MNKLLTLAIVSLMALSQTAFGQNVALKTNLLYGGATLTPNLGLEIGLGKKTTLELTGGYNPWNLNGSEDNNKKFVHYLAQAEFRYWTCERFNGHFFGVHGLYSQFNVSQNKVPPFFNNGTERYRYEGSAIGGGISYGYQWLLGKRWSLEATVGVGVAYLEYDKFECPKCGENLGRETKTYFGPTKLGVSLIYIIK